MAAKPKSYEELLEERQKEWQAAQNKAGAELAALHGKVAKMPDVANAPDPTSVWGHPGIRCECGSEGFRVARWVTVNGVRYRVQVECLACKGNRTWDWNDKRWIEPARFYLPDVGKR